MPLAAPMMPRSSSGEFHAVFRPCVAVKTPPSGGPTSSPKMSVTPRRVSPTWSAMRIACTIVDIDFPFGQCFASVLERGAVRAPDDVHVGEDVVVDGIAVGLR